jgi:ribosomal protein S18 acetylase RimI-like enzyme
VALQHVKYANTSFDKDAWVVWNLCTSPSLRNRGLASALIQKCQVITGYSYSS